MSARQRGRAWSPRAVLVALCVVNAVSSTAGVYNFTYSIASQCKEHISSDGYHYSPFYRVRPTRLQPGSVLDMHIAVLAPQDGHILLSTSEHPALDEPVYEIVIGAGANRFSEIRRFRKKGTKRSERTTGILSAISFTPFWIRLTDEGGVQVYREGEPLPFLQWEDPEPLHIKYFSFATWLGVQAKFLYDCPAPGGDNNETTDSEATPPRLTAAQRLKSSLLGAMTSSVTVPPLPLVDVRLGVSLSSITLDVHASVMHTLLAVTMKWKDPQLSWEPSQYNDTVSLRLQQTELWTPQLYVHNSIDVGELSPLSPEPVYVRPSGELTLHVLAAVSTWCAAEGAGAGGSDVTCRLYFAPWIQHESLNLSLHEDFANVENAQRDVVSNTWEVVDVQHALGSSELSPFSDVTCARQEARGEPGTLYVLQLTLRLRDTRRLAHCTPLLVLAVLAVVTLSGAATVRHRDLLSGGVCVALAALVCNARPNTSMTDYEVVLLSVPVALAVRGLLSKAPDRLLLALDRCLSWRPLAVICGGAAAKSYARMGEAAPGAGSEDRERCPGARARVLSAADCLLALLCSLLYAALLASTL